MKKLSIFILIFLFILLLFLATKMTFAQETFSGSFLSIGANYAICLISPNNLMAGISYLHYFGGWFGIGAGIDFLYNFNYEDLYITGFIRLALRRFYFDVGVTNNTIPSSKENMIDFQEPVYPYFAICVDLIQFESESGAFNINLLLGMLFTSFPIITVETDNFLASIIADIIANGMGMVLNSIKLGIGFTYTFYLG